MQADAERFLTHVSARRAAAAAPLQAGNFGEPSNCIPCALLASLKAKATNLGSLEPAALAGFILQATRAGAGRGRPRDSGAAGRPQQRSFHRGPQDTHTPFTWDLVHSLTLLPLLSAFFSSSNFTCKTLQAVTRKHLTYFTAFQSFLIKSDVYPSNLRAPRCPAVASPGPPSRCCAQGSGEGAGERDRERDRSHLAHLQAAAGRLSGHFFRNANHALSYHTKPLIANDALRTGGERLPPAGAGEEPWAEFVGPALPSSSSAGSSRGDLKCRWGRLLWAYPGSVWVCILSWAYPGSVWVSILSWAYPVSVWVCISARAYPGSVQPMPAPSRTSRGSPEVAAPEGSGARRRATEPQPWPMCGSSARGRWVHVLVHFRDGGV
ncbi:uncharacterized protein LOC117000172 [Catharus ustulatus]|uniref:uncharacterized protein LOC117000172 n=1 Tax=Catharus ustulatus TaxID=91951 RepID=UPI001C5BE297|nr:uncharacterized protein LOC117000172 [Catharus ustulatus]